MGLEVKLKRVGNSVGIILPKNILEKMNLRKNERIVIEIVKEADLTDIFGAIKKRKISGQEFKNLVREGWKA